MAQTRRVTIARDAAVATAILVGLYAIGQWLQFPPFFLPRYFLIVGFDLLERTFGSAGAYYYPLFATYLLGLGLVGAGVAHAVRTEAAENVPPWRLAAAGTFVVIGGISLLLAIALLVGTAQLVPVLITGVTGLVLLTGAAWLVGRIDVDISIAGERRG